MCIEKVLLVDIDTFIKILYESYITAQTRHLLLWLQYSSKKTFVVVVEQQFCQPLTQVLDKSTSENMKFWKIGKGVKYILYYFRFIYLLLIFYCICHTSIFDLKSYIHTPSDSKYYLTFQIKIRQRGTLKYLIFYSFQGPHYYFIISLFYLFYFYQFLFYFISIFYFIFILFFQVIFFLFITQNRSKNKISKVQKKIQVKCQL